MFISQEDIYELFRFATRNVARSLGVQDTDFKSAYEMNQEIENLDKDIHGKLNDFLEAYQNWYKFCEKLESENKYGNLSSEEQIELRQLEEKRDQTRTTLIQSINKP